MEITELLLSKDSEANLRLPDPDLLMFYKQLEERIIWIDDEIDAGVLEATKQIILWNHEDRCVEPEDRIPIKICIFSPGGNLAETMHTCSIIKMSRTPVYTINMGMAMSGGFLLLVAGHKRFTLPYARSMCHGGSGVVGGTAAQAKDAMDDYQAQIKDMRDFVIENTKITKSQYTKKRERDWYMGADDMIKYGVVDHIIADIGEIIE